MSYPKLILPALLAAYSALAQAPSVVRHPADTTVFFGDPASFNVVAVGTAPLSYQWYRDGSAIPAATGSTLTVSQVRSNDASAAFTVTIANSLGWVTSQVASLTVDFGTLGAAQTNRLVTITNVWRYNVNGTNLPPAWTTAGYSDSSWASGQALLYTANSSRTSNITGGPLLTDLKLTVGALPTTCYFRSHFTNPAPASAAVALAISTVVDDGVVVHLNGEPAFRLAVPYDPAYYTNYSDRTVGDPAPEGPSPFAVTNLVPGDNVLAAEVHQANATSSDIVWGMTLDAVIAPRYRDTNAPTATSVLPAPGSTVASFRQFEIHFSEGVKGVTAGSLLVNGSPATNVTPYSSDVYVFDFPSPAAGLVQVSWAAGHMITDLSANSNRFAGGTYTYTLDPSLLLRTVRINEFMAGNSSTIRDNDGRYSDWIELYNSSSTAVNLGGWYLTDNPSVPTKWRFPSGFTIAGRDYLLIWASGQDRANPAAPLHTSFRLDKGAGASLALVYSDGQTVVSAFAPYPQQYDDVSYGCDRADASIVGYFTAPTPDAANATLGAGFGPEVAFSVPGGTFQQAFTLQLSTAEPNATIRYLLVTNASSATVTLVPDQTSPVYTGPIAISGSVQVRARAFSAQANKFPGPVHNESYLQVTPSAASFSSDLPIVVFHNMGAGGVAASEDQFVTIQVFDTKNGRSTLTNAPDMVLQGYFHRRGQTTFWNPKANLRVETQDAYGANLDVALLGLPAEDDWVFYGINVFDKALMHNPLAQELYRQMGHYTSRTRFCEVFLKDDSGTPGALTSADYNGLYVLLEKIKVSNNRIEEEPLQPENTTSPSVTGTYLLSIDKSNPGLQDNLANASVWYLDPDFSQVYVQQQLDYIRGYFGSFYSALYGANWTNPVTGYAPYIDMSTWIDFHLHQTFLFSADALRISTYFYKPRGNPIVQGPLWDFDRSFGTGSGGDFRGFNPRRWRSGASDGGTDMFNAANTFHNPWYGRLFLDPDFWQRWIDRYQELRRTTYSLEHLMTLVDGYGNEVRESTAREYTRWRGQGSSDTSPRAGTISGDGLTYTFPSPGTWQGEIDFTKYWFSNRVAFMDGQFLNPPAFSGSGGAIAPGYSLTITAPTVVANSTIYYTLDGTDPRLPGGAVRPGALSALNAVTLTLNSNARVFARNYNASHRNLTGANNPPLSSSWSGPTVATFYTAVPPLRISEIMYNPLAPGAGSTNNNDDFEYIEFYNPSGASINLRGYSLSGGVDFAFGNYTLGAGQSVLIVRNLAAFQSRYPGVSNIAGAYTNNLSNSGERLALTGPLGEPVLDFTFNDSWYPTTDGLGFSLVAVDAGAPVTAWNSALGWRPSSALNGSPGVADPAPPSTAPVRITEALTHTDPPQVDTVELWNSGTNWADISGWYLTDDRQTPSKYQFPPNTRIPPGGYALFTTNDFGVGANGFSLSSTGDEIYLFAAASSGANLTGYAHGFDFGAAPNGISFGRHTDSLGGEHFVLQSANTLGTNNAYPRMGPVVISEIMYHPPDPYPGANDELNEYIELANITSTNVPLFDPAAPTNRWRLNNAVEFDFPAGASLAAGARLVVVSFDPVRYPATRAAFTTRYGLPADVPVYGPWSGALNNSDDDVELRRPDNPNVTPTNTVVPYYLVERVRYTDTMPWPTNTDGQGNALQRIQPTLFANDPGNWRGVTPFSNKPALPSITLQPTNVTTYSGSNVLLVAAAGGTDPLSYQWYFNLTNRVAAGTGPILTIANVQASNAGTYRLVVTNIFGSATSQLATVTVVAAPQIVSQPADQVVAPGQTAEFEVAAVGTGLTYAWYYNTNTLLPGTAANLLLFGVQASQAGTYHVVISNPYGTVTSRYARLTVVSAPVITLQPTNVTLLPGADASFAVGASGANLSYQWYFNATNPLPVGTNALLSLTQVAPARAGAYHAVVSNASGSATSSSALLRVLVAPELKPGSLSIGAAGVSVSVETLAQLLYQLEYKQNLPEAGWTPVVPAQIGTGGVITFTDTNAPAGGKRFYRVRCY